MERDPDFADNYCAMCWLV